MSSFATALASLGYDVDSSGNPIIDTPLAPARPTATTPDLTSEQDIINGLGNTTYVIPGSAVEVTPGGQIVTTLPSGTTTTQASGASLGSGILGQFELWLQSEASNTVSVIVGLVLIAGAVWGFDTVRDSVVSTAKGAAALAA